MTETKTKRRWFSFSIRELFWLTLVVALAVGWWLDHRRYVDLENRFTALEQSASVAKLRELETKISSKMLDCKVIEQSNKTLMYELDRLREAAKK